MPAIVRDLNASFSSCQDAVVLGIRFDLDVVDFNLDHGCHFRKKVITESMYPTGILVCVRQRSAFALASALDVLFKLASVFCDGGFDRPSGTVGETADRGSGHHTDGI